MLQLLPKARPLVVRPLLRQLFCLVLLLMPLAACSRKSSTPTPTPPPTAAAAADTTQATPASPVNEAATNVPSTPAATVVPTPTPLTGHLVLWHSWAQAEGDALAAILEQAKNAYPAIQIDTLFVAPSDIVASYADAVAAGSGPDLLLAPNWWLGDLARAHAILNLDTVVGGDLNVTYWPAAVDAMRYEGTLYALPVTANLVALYVNQNLVPDTGTPADTTALLNAASITPTAGIGLYATLFHAYWGFPAYGAQLLDANGLVTLDQSSGAAGYLTWLNALNSTPGSYVNTDYGMLLDRFKKGEFAYFVDGPWALNDLHAVLGDALRVVPLPAGPGGPAQPWLYSDGLFVNPTISVEQQTLALNVGLFFTGDSAGTILATVGGLLPASRNADLKATPLLQGFAAQAATAQAMPTTSEMQSVWTYGGDMLVKALAGVAEPSAVVSETTTLINEANGK